MRKWTLTRGGRGDSPQEAVQAAIEAAIGAASVSSWLEGDASYGADVKAIDVLPREQNPMVPTAGKTWYDAVAVVSFPVKEGFDRGGEEEE